MLWTKTKLAGRDKWRYEWDYLVIDQLFKDIGDRAKKRYRSTDDLYGMFGFGGLAINCTNRSLLVWKAEFDCYYFQIGRVWNCNTL